MEMQSSLVTIAPRPIKQSTPLLPHQSNESANLTRKQKNFVEHYLRGKSAYQAAILAGYSETTAQVATSVIAKSPAVIRELRRRQIEFFKDHEAGTDWILSKAFALANANMLDYYTFSADGKITLDLTKVTREMGAAIQELSFDPEGRPKIRLVEQKGALELFARLNKMLGSKEEDGGEDGPLTVQALDRLVQQHVTVNQQINIYQPQTGQQSSEVIEGQ